MTEKYLKQLELEKLNKEIFDRITAEIPVEDFIDFYLNHNKKETLEYYNIRTEKLLRKILEFFNYDFTKPKPSKFRGKSACRSHESYVNAGKKSAETQKQHWAAKSEDEKKAWSEKQKVSHNTESFKKQIKQINIDYQASLSDKAKEQIRLKKQAKSREIWAISGAEIQEKQRKACLQKYGFEYYPQTAEYKKIIQSAECSQQRAQRNYNTKKQNNSFSISKPEERYYEFLVSKYGEENIVRQYKDERYPYACDFYIKPLDLFIELNLTWSHGKHPFKADSIEDQAKLVTWCERAKKSDYYKNAIKVWTIKDPEKFACAERNNLNYKVYYDEAELYQ